MTDSARQDLPQLNDSHIASTLVACTVHCITLVQSSLIRCLQQTCESAVQSTFILFVTLPHCLMLGTLRKPTQVRQGNENHHTNFKILFPGVAFPSKSSMSESSNTYPNMQWARAMAQLVEALRYKAEGRGFDSRWCHWNSSWT